MKEEASQHFHISRETTICIDTAVQVKQWIMGSRLVGYVAETYK